MWQSLDHGDDWPSESKLAGEKRRKKKHHEQNILAIGQLAGGLSRVTLSNKTEHNNRNHI